MRLRQLRLSIQDLTAEERHHLIMSTRNSRRVSKKPIPKKASYKKPVKGIIGLLDEMNVEQLTELNKILEKIVK